MLQKIPTLINSGTEILSFEYMKVTSMFDTVNEVCHVLATLNACRICKGNSESQFTSLPSIHEDVLKNQSRKLIQMSLTCHSIISPGTNVVAKVQDVDSACTRVICLSYQL